MGTNWLQEYSTFNMNQIQTKIISSLKDNSSDYNMSVGTKGTKKFELMKLTKNHSFNTMRRQQTQISEIFFTSKTHEFDVFTFAEQIGRQHALPYLIVHLLDNLPSKEENFGNFNENKLVLFLNQIQMGYQQKVAYHNDLHGVDVAQFMFLLIKDAQLDRVADLRYLDMTSAIIAAVCHDYDHDGFNNAYHVNKMTMRALRYHDESVQENYHAAESISIMLKPEFNFLENASKDDVKVFRKRMVGMILSTDMAKHMQDLT